MGTNKRYADQVDRRQTQRGTPSTLHDAQLQLDRYPLTRPPKPVRVKVWVDYPLEHLLVDAQLVAWTTRAVAVRWRTVDGEVHKAWVWGNAVEESESPIT